MTKSLALQAARAAALAALVVAAALGCGGDGSPSEPDAPVVASVEVTPGIDTLIALGQTRQFTAAAKDANGNPVTGKTFLWQSSAPAVATVDPTSGLVSAVSNGAATITATVDQKSGQAALAVAQQVATVAVTPGTAALSALGSTQQFAAEARDANNNVVSGVPFIWLSSNHNVITVTTSGLAAAVGPGSATVTGAARGIPGTAALTVTQTATQLAFTVHPTSATAGEALSPAVQVEIQDAGGSRVASARDPVTVALGANPGAGTLSGTRTVNAVNGIATFSGLSVDKAATGYTLSAGSGSLLGAASDAFAITAAAPAKLAFSVQPSNTVAGAIINPAVRVAVVDRFGNLVPTAPGYGVRLHIEFNAGGGTLLGTPTVAAVAGEAVFDNVAIDRAGSGYHLRAAVPYTLNQDSDVLTPVKSSPFDITAGAATKLAFVVQPTPSEGAQAIAPAPKVAIQDALGNTVTSATNPVTLTLSDASCPPGPSSGTTTVDAVNGIATFNNVRIDRPCEFHKLVAAAGPLVGATSDMFAVKLTFSILSAGYDHTCGLTAALAVYCWGTNSFGQLGDGTSVNKTRPVLVQAPAGVTFGDVSAGNFHTCAVTRTGAIYCWGYNFAGQLGDGTTMNRTSPVLLQAPEGVTFASVSAGAYHTCGATPFFTGFGVVPHGPAYCWGSNYAGQLGDESAVNKTSPVLVAGGLNFARVSAGLAQTCGVASPRAPYCWGSNTFGELGDGTTVAKTSPTLVTGSLDFAYLSAGGSSGEFDYAHTCGVTVSGIGYCWGSNIYGRLGDGTIVDKASPAVVAGGLTFRSASFLGPEAGTLHTCGVTSAFAAYCWGSNYFGQLGDGTGVDKTSPALVAGGLTFYTLTTGGGHTCGTTSSGAFCWGHNAAGQLGDGTTANTPVPVRVLQQ